MNPTHHTNTILEISDLQKEYPGFRLNHVSFSLNRGSIMGLVGRNGAGKTTTIKSMLGLIRPSGGTISCFGMELSSREAEIKKRIGYACGAVDYYKKKPIRDIAAVTKLFYENWDDAAYRHYLELFSLRDEKTPEALSEGMRVKLNLALALSHHAELLVLDEPTSGLDPVSRSELLTIFRYLAQETGTAILFSTHITTDLESCADMITYLKNGTVQISGALPDYLADCRSRGLGKTLEEIMIHDEQEAFHEKTAH